MAADTTDKLDNNHASGVDQSADSLQPYGATLRAKSTKIQRDECLDLKQHR